MLYKNQFFNVALALDALIPGYLIIRPNRKLEKFTELNIEEQLAFAGTVSICENIIEEIINPERIYLLNFAEIDRNLHFHIFPRSKELGEEFKLIHKQEQINGPFLFQWARQEFNEKKLGEYDKLISKLKQKFNAMSF